MKLRIQILTYTFLLLEILTKAPNVDSSAAENSEPFLKMSLFRKMNLYICDTEDSDLKSLFVRFADNKNKNSANSTTILM